MGEYARLLAFERLIPVVEQVRQVGHMTTRTASP